MRSSRHSSCSLGRKPNPYETAFELQAASHKANEVEISIRNVPATACKATHVAPSQSANERPSGRKAIDADVLELFHGAHDRFKDAVERLNVHHFFVSGALVDISCRRSQRPVRLNVHQWNRFSRLAACYLQTRCIFRRVAMSAPDYSHDNPSSIADDKVDNQPPFCLDFTWPSEQC